MYIIVRRLSGLADRAVREKRRVTVSTDCRRSLMQRARKKRRKWERSAATAFRLISSAARLVRQSRDRSFSAFNALPTAGGSTAYARQVQILPGAGPVSVETLSFSFIANGKFYKLV